MRNENLYLEVYQQLENVRFYGIREASGTTDENIKKVLVGFMQNELISVRRIPLSFKEFIASGDSNPHKISQDRSSLGFCDILIQSW